MKFASRFIACFFIFLLLSLPVHAKNSSNEKTTFTDQAKEAVRHSAYTFLHKPLDIDILLELLARIQQHNISGLYEKPESKS